MKKCYLILFFYTIGCVGPTTPFGAVNDIFPKATDITNGKNTKDSPVKIIFKPQKQVLHDKNNFIVEIKDKNKIPDSKDIKLFYNTLDVTEQFLAQSEIKKSVKDKTLQLSFNNLRLKILDENNIRMFYRSTDENYVSSFEAPTCDLIEDKDVRVIKGFQPPDEYLTWVHEISRRSKMNPSFLTGIVAQESSFNPKAVSSAKALGLTQITPLAEEQINSGKKDWPRRDISSLSYSELKTQVMSGEINEKTDWRLSPRHSLEGGAEYIQYLRTYWKSDDNIKLIKNLPGDEQINLSKIILASYNSGPARVKNSIQSRGDKWLEDTSLKEARKYIKLVFSYCYHFSERVAQDDG